MEALHGTRANLLIMGESWPWVPAGPQPCVSTWKTGWKMRPVDRRWPHCARDGLAGSGGQGSQPREAPHFVQWAQKWKANQMPSPNGLPVLEQQLLVGVVRGIRQEEGP